MGKKGDDNAVMKVEKKWVGDEKLSRKDQKIRWLCSVQA
jgi:hypothetical protein